MLIENIGLAVRVILPDIFGLFQRNHAGDGTRIGKVLVISLSRALNKHDGLGFLAVRGAQDFALGSDFFKLVIGDHIGNGPIAKMGEFAFSGQIGPPAGSQNHGAEFFAIGIQGQNVVFALVEFFIQLVQFVLIQFLAVFIHFHFRRQRKRNVKFQRFAGFFQGHGKIAGLSGNTGYGCVRFLP